MHLKAEPIKFSYTRETKLGKGEQVIYYLLQTSLIQFKLSKQKNQLPYLKLYEK